MYGDCKKNLQKKEYKQIKVCNRFIRDSLNFKINGQKLFLKDSTSVS